MKSKKTGKTGLNKVRREDIRRRINICGESPEAVANWYNVPVVTVLKIAGIR